MESVESIRKKELALKILKNDSIIVAHSLANHQSFAKSRSQIKKEIQVPLIIDVLNPEN